MDCVKPTRRSRVDRFLDVLAEYDSCQIIMHDNPDPDAIAAGWLIKHLIQHELDCRTRLVAGGGIVRAENRHMVSLLKPPIQLVNQLKIGKKTAAILVDCAMSSSNQLLRNSGVRPVAVIDHHLEKGGRNHMPFRDVRRHVAASVTIAASYLRERHIEPTREMASAGLYAIRTETCGSEFQYSRLDRTMVLWLTERADPSLIARIENAPLTRKYFGDMLLAIQNTFLYEHTAFCILPRASCVEIVGEVADLLIRCQSIRQVLCGAKVGNNVYVSVRTCPDAGNATELVQETLDGLGSSGGHAHRAGGKVTRPTASQRVPESIEDELRNRWLTVCRVQRRRGTRLVPLREITENL